MSSFRTFGYTGNLLRVDLTKSKSFSEPIDEATLRKHIGGAALGIKFIYDEVPPGTQWSAPENRLFLGSGPLGGTRIGGSGAVAVVTKGALTNGIASSQANGFFGAFLRFSGFDAMIVEGVAPGWVYVYVHDGIAEIRDASHLAGSNTVEVDQAIKKELKKKERDVSILTIGPAGENLIRFACISSDLGHMAAHNGVGAVMGSKKLKAVVVERGKNIVQLKDKESLSQMAKKILTNTLGNLIYAVTAAEGTVGGVPGGALRGTVPVKNYQTSVIAMDPQKLNSYSSDNIRQKFNAKPNPCWACSSKHCHKMEVTEGKYAGRVFEEPEYEGMAAFSSLLGIDDVTTTVVLASEVDRLGMDANETGWVLSWLMECTQEHVLGKDMTDGIEMTWGNGEAIMAMMNKIARREGFGNVLAEGVMRAAQHIGGEAPSLAIHSAKGNTPRSHDHRVMWLEMFDTCVSNTGTLETHMMAPFKLLGLPDRYDNFSPEAISTMEARIKGAMLFEDSLVTCRFQTGTALDLLSQAINSATGWDFDFQEAMVVGRRAANLARVFNLRQGIGPELDRPSKRYGSTPVDGPGAGRGIMPQWDMMLQNYYNLMGWDKDGKPLPETLKGLGLENIVPHLK